MLLLKLDEKQNRYILEHKDCMEGRTYCKKTIDEEKFSELIRIRGVNIQKKNKPWDEKL
ncbi:hypothetical protein NHP200010_07420 [Helicobacter bizzozeronii]|nr:hypothetical protein NHP200010_07420 [Helicobacter bizzozeronii]